MIDGARHNVTSHGLAPGRDRTRSRQTYGVVCVTGDEGLAIGVNQPADKWLGKTVLTLT